MSPPLSRRTFLAGAAAAAVAAACGDNSDRSALSSTTAGTAATTALPPGTTVPPATAAAGAARFVTNGGRDTQQVALTFHTDGDLGLADQILSTLAQRDVHVTSFIVGQWLDANPTWAQKLVDAGHELANHTYTHPSFSQLSPAAMLDEIVRCRDVIARLADGAGSTYFRPSGTADGTTTPPAAVMDAATQAGYAVVLGFDDDPFDYQDPGSAEVVQRTLAAAQPGSVVSLHFGHPGTITALPQILDGLAQQGLQPVTTSQLLGSA